MNTWKHTCRLILLLLVLGGCSQDPEPPPEAETAVPAASSGGETAGGKEAKEDDAMAVSIVPVEPTTEDDLRAVLHGYGRIGGFTWERNSEVISEVQGDELASRYFRKGDTVTLVVRGENGSARATTTIGNTPPRVLSVAFADPYIHHGVAIEAQPEAIDIDGDPVTFSYSWTVNGEELSWLDRPVLPAERVHKGDRILLAVTPSDGEDEGPVFSGDPFVVPNAPPEFVSTPPASFEGRIYRYEVRAEDPDGDAVTYSLERAPSRMTIDPDSGQIEWQIDADDGGEHRIRIVATDVDGMRAIQEYSLSLSIPE